MTTLLVSITVWYLLVGGQPTVIPSPFMSKEDCLVAGQEQYLSPGDAEGETWSSYTCVQGKLYD